MINRLIGLISAWTAVALIGAPLGQAQPQQPQKPFPPIEVVADSPSRELATLRTKVAKSQTVRIIVELKAGAVERGDKASQATAQAAISTAQVRFTTSMRALDVKFIKPLRRLPYVVLQVNRAQLEQVVANDQVRVVVEDKLSAPTLQQSIPLVKAPDVWATGSTGQGQAVAILDTGVESTHPFLSPRIKAEACFSSNDTTYNSTTVCPDGSEVQIAAGAGAPCNFGGGCFHGTHVAGIAAGRKPDLTHFGVAKDSDIIAIQVFSKFINTSLCGSTAPCALSWGSDQLQALQYVLDLKTGALGPAVPVAAANMSLGGGLYSTYCDSDPLKPKIDQLLAAGVATVIASGNSYSKNAISAPSCISTAVTVGASTKPTETVPAFSNSSSLVELLAPGVSINSSTLAGGYTSASGTSMATPHVAGAFALLKSRAPTATPTQILDALIATGVPITDPANSVTKPRICLSCAAKHLSNVWMKDGTADTGAEPDPAMASLPMWESPYIWVRHPNNDGAANPLAHMNPEIGSPNFAYVEVRNNGTTTPPGWLKLYYANASLSNLNSTSSWIPVGSQQLTSLAPGVNIVEFPWTNMPSTGGHYCMLAFWTETNAPLSFTDVNQAVRNSNDLIWRNMNVVDLLPMVKPKPDVTPDLSVELRGSAKGENYLVFMGKPPVRPGLEWSRAAQITFSLDPEVAGRATAAGGSIKALGRGRFALVLDGKTAAVGPLTVKPGAITKINIRVDADRQTVQKISDGLKEPAVFPLRAIHASKEGAALLVRGRSEAFDRPGLVAGGVTYQLTIPAKKR